MERVALGSMGFSFDVDKVWFDSSRFEKMFLHLFLLLLLLLLNWGQVCGSAAQGREPGGHVPGVWVRDDPVFGRGDVHRDLQPHPAHGRRLHAQQHVLALRSNHRTPRRLQGFVSFVRSGLVRLALRSLFSSSSSSFSIRFGCVASPSPPSPRGQKKRNRNNRYLDGDSWTKSGNKTSSVNQESGIISNTP